MNNVTLDLLVYLYRTCRMGEIRELRRQKRRARWYQIAHFGMVFHAAVTATIAILGIARMQLPQLLIGIQLCGAALALVAAQRLQLNKRKAEAHVELLHTSIITLDRAMADTLANEKARTR